MGSAMDDDASPFVDDVDPAPSSGARAASAWKVLIVDDEPEVHDVTLLALRGVRKQPEQHFGDDKRQHAVAEELQPLIVCADLAAHAGMGQRSLQQPHVMEGVAGALRNRRQGISGGSFQRHQRTKLSRRVGRISVGHFQISSGLAPPAMEKKMMLARPTRLS